MPNISQARKKHLNAEVISPFSGPWDTSFFTRKAIFVFEEWLNQALICESYEDRSLSYLKSSVQNSSDPKLVEDYYLKYAELDGRNELQKVIEQGAIDFSKCPPDISDLHSMIPLDAMPKLFTSKKNLDLLSSLQEAWVNYGFIVLQNALKDDLIDSYLKLRNDHGCHFNGSDFSEFTEIRNLFCNSYIANTLRLLTGGDVSLYIVFAHSLTSTERPWHQDQYLIGDNIYGSSVSAWVALGDVTEDQGPFQLIPGSHRFGILDYDKASCYLNSDCRIGESRGSLWTSYTHLLTSQAYSKLFLNKGIKSYSFTPRKGDLLISHPRLIHRAGLPSGINNRPGIIGQWTTFDSPLASGKLKKDTKESGWFWY